MLRTKLIEALRTLQTKERRRWQAYLHAGFFNKNEQLWSIADYLLRFEPTFEHPNLVKKQVFRHIFGTSEPYEELKLNNLISDLYSLLLDFLAFTRREQDDAERQYQRVMALLDRNLDKQAGKELEKYRILLDRSPVRNAEWFQRECQWWETAEMLYLRQGRRQAGEHLQRQAEATLTAQMLDKLRLQISALNLGALAVLKSEEKPSWLLHLNIPTDKQAEWHTIPAAKAYQAACRLLENPCEHTYYDLLEILNVHSHVLNREEAKALYQCALNYTIRRINDGQPDAYSDAHFLYRELIRLGLLLRQGTLSQWSYKNIATAGLRTGEFEWTENFLHEYLAFLPVPERENAFTYNLAGLYFEKQEYNKALEMLRDVEFTDVTYQLGAKTMLLKIFYLLEEQEALLALIDSTQQLLRRNKSLSAFGKTTNLNFLSALRQLLRWQSGKNLAPARLHKKKRTELIQLFREMHPLANKDWLLKMLGQ